MICLKYSIQKSESQLAEKWIKSEQKTPVLSRSFREIVDKLCVMQLREVANIQIEAPFYNSDVICYPY